MALEDPDEGRSREGTDTNSRSSPPPARARRAKEVKNQEEHHALPASCGHRASTSSLLHSLAMLLKYVRERLTWSQGRRRLRHTNAASQEARSAVHPAALLPHSDRLGCVISSGKLYISYRCIAIYRSCTASSPPTSMGGGGLHTNALPIFNLPVCGETHERS